MARTGVGAPVDEAIGNMAVARARAEAAKARAQVRAFIVSGRAA